MIPPLKNFNFSVNPNAKHIISAAKTSKTSQYKIKEQKKRTQTFVFLPTKVNNSTQTIAQLLLFFFLRGEQTHGGGRGESIDLFFRGIYKQEVKVREPLSPCGRDNLTFTFFI